jgi:type IV pilus assembly protein PilY1
MITHHPSAAISRLATTFLVAMSLVLPATSWGFTPSTKPAETQSVPGNMLLALSVEFPTGLQVSYSGNYDTNALYDGYFDNRKCYSYSNSNEVFNPASGKTSTGACPDSDHWSGNVLNWLTMTNLDQFRSVMTGGTRDNFSSKNSDYSGDTVGSTARTLLIRSFSDRNSYFGDKTLSSAWPGVPTSFNGRIARSGGNGSKLYIHDTAGSNPSNNGDLETRLKKCSDSSISNNFCVNVRIEVCKEVAATANSGAVGREDNCVGPYGTSPDTYFKPQGLIQEYSNSIRFGAMGYLNQTGQTRDGGVLRARMKSVGPIKIGENGASNSNKEWNTDGTLVSNPDSTDATNSSVNQSGVINYLNKFGYTSGYKGNDPVGELYYASLLYFRNTALPAQYTNSLTDALKDGFPVITSFSDPIIKSCQKNFILGLGDKNTHCDGNLPNSPSNGGATCNNNANPTDASIDTTSLWNSIVSMEGSSTWAGASTEGKPYMAGLAWWANVNDIRSDLTGKQSIATYWVDVLENNNGGTGIAAKTQYWLAAKYGGFRQDLTANNSTNPNSAAVSWDKDGNSQPDTLFAGNNPQALKAGLRSAFADILARADDSSASSAAVTSNRQTSTSQIVYAGYNPKDWTGSIRACSPTQNSAQCDATPIWEASRWFNTTYTAGASPKLNNTNRKIFTSINVSGIFSKSAFLWDELNATQKTALNAADSDGSDRVNYIRGSRTHENSKFRTRGAALIADVVNSNVNYLAGSGPLLKGPNFSGHAAYRTSNASRASVVYVGTNDGMLHALDAANGKELWAYVPGATYPKLAGLTSTSYAHEYFVDATAMVGDTQTGDTSTPWRTMLVGGLGGGGKAYYALDISRQTPQANNDGTPNASGLRFSTMTETELANIPMWEFTSAQDTDLGYTYYEPSIDSITGRFNQIAKVASSTVAGGVWRAILNNGYGSTGNSAVLFFLNTETGAVSTKLTATSSGSGDNGLSSPTPVDTDNDGLIDTVYAGDLRGRMHKFQFSKSDSTNTNYIRAASGDVDGVWRHIGALYEAAKPITVAPAVTKACTGSTGWQVLFGTGKLNENADFTNTDSNLFINVLDEGVSSSLTVTSTSLADITPVTTTVVAGNVRNWATPTMTSKKGWKVNLAAGERVISNPSLPPDSGAVLFGTAKPSGDLCDPGSSGYLMAVKVCSGATGDIEVGDGANLVSVGGYGVAASGILKTSNTYTNNNNKQSTVCNQPSCQGPGAPTLKSTGSPGGRYSWRQILSR